MVRLPITDVTDDDTPEFYHKGYDARKGVAPELRRFIAWDGEGMSLSGPNRPQHYVLFGASTGDVIKGETLKTVDICDFILSVAERNPNAWHVGFAFKYDANMIVKSLGTNLLNGLHRKGFVKFEYQDRTYCIIFRPGKWLSISRYGQGYSKRNKHRSQTVKIYDLFGFFGKSFVAAVRECLGDVPELALVEEGKARRMTFNDMEYVERYWRTEIALLERLANNLRERMYGAGLRITQWHGPGALASYAMKQHKIKEHMAETSDAIRLAARHAYAGGRFELFQVGRIDGPIYSVDINSAYPHAISQLPSLSEGSWRYVSRPDRIARFGVYHVRMKVAAGFRREASPLFHRDERHNISYPWLVENWYWSPEVAGLVNTPGVEIVEGWEYVGSHTRPFDWVQDMYEQRREYKRKGYPAQLALKLCMNSLYGKMAQRVGYDMDSGRIPPWHQLEWAGWVTSYTRSSLYRIMQRIAPDNLIAVETDGIYTTINPAQLGITNSEKLGGWEVTTYDEMVYIQSGLAFLRQGDTWTEKYRGLDKGSFPIESALDYVKSLRPNEPWQPYVGRTTRFVGLGAALATQATAPLKVRHCRWETREREILPGEKGKRIHVPRFCRACKSNADAYDMAHDLVIRSTSRAGVMSVPHHIPWDAINVGESEWLAMAETVGEVIQ